MVCSARSDILVGGLLHIPCILTFKESTLVSIKAVLTCSPASFDAILEVYLLYPLHCNSSIVGTFPAPGRIQMCAAPMVLFHTM